MKAQGILWLVASPQPNADADATAADFRLCLVARASRDPTSVWWVLGWTGDAAQRFWTTQAQALSAGRAIHVELAGLGCGEHEGRPCLTATIERAQPLPAG